MSRFAASSGIVSIGLCEDGRGGCPHKTYDCKKITPGINGFSWDALGSKISFGATCGVAGVWSLDADVAQRVRVGANEDRVFPDLLASWFGSTNDEPIMAFDAFARRHVLNKTLSETQSRQIIKLPINNCKLYVAAGHTSSTSFAAAYRSNDTGSYYLAVWLCNGKKFSISFDTMPTSISWNSAGNMLAIGDENGYVSIYRPFDMRRIFYFQGIASPITGSCWSPDDVFFCYCSPQNDKIRIWSPIIDKHLPDIKDALSVMSVAIMGQGEFIAAKNRYGNIGLWRRGKIEWEKLMDFLDETKAGEEDEKSPLSFNNGSTLLSSYSEKNRNISVRDIFAI